MRRVRRVTYFTLPLEYIVLLTETGDNKQDTNSYQIVMKEKWKYLCVIYRTIWTVAKPSAHADVMVTSFLNLNGLILE